MFRWSIRKVLVVTGLAGLCSCMTAVPGGLSEAHVRSVQREGRPVVPAVPPDSTPAWVYEEIYRPENIVREDSIMTGPYPRDMIWLWFRDDAPQELRQAAIDAIDGLVVGGKAVRPGGVYYVRIEHDGTSGSLHRAIAPSRACLL